MENFNSFNWNQYLANYQDLQQAGLNNHLDAWKHYKRFGLKEGRTDKLYFNGINNVDIVYYINLEHRKDRFEHITNELKHIKNLHRIEAIYNKENGMLGATMSHCIALEHFINSNLETCIIFEDDFKFTSSTFIVDNMFNNFFNSKYLKEYDILMLSASTKTEKVLESYLTKIYHSQTASGYSISKKFAPILLENYKEIYQIDINWLKLQPVSNWYSLKPRVGLQIESYSDNTYRIENYRL